MKQIIRTIGLMGMLAVFASGCLNAPPPTGPKVDTQLAEQTSVGRVAFELGDARQAIIFFQRALDRARVMDSPADIASAAYNLGAALVRDGRYDDARAVLREAEFETRRAGVNAADVLLLQAKVARLRDDPAETFAFTTRVLTDKAAKPDNGHRLQAFVLQGEAALDSGDAEGARKEMLKARDMLGLTSTPTQRAAVTGLGARLSQSARDPAGAATQYDQQAGMYRQAGLYRDMATALARAGAAWQEAGQSANAADRYYRAARSLEAQGAREADAAAKSALAAAEKARDPDLLQRVRGLQSLRRSTTAPTSQGTEN